MRHRLTVLVLVACISLAPLIARGQEQPDGVPISMAEIPGLKSGMTAFLWSFLGTAVPTLVGAWDVYRENSSDSVVPGIMVVGGLLFGPSLGHFYADRPGPALVGIGIRTVAGLGVAVAAAEQLGEGTDYQLEWLAVAGAFLGGASLVWDIARAPHSAGVHNDELRQSHVSLGVTPSIRAAGFGLYAEVSF
jgi:hypothetical protein